MSSSTNAAASRSVTGISGKSIIEAVNASSVGFVVSVPDITTSEGLLRPLTVDRELKLIRVCKEDEGVGILNASTQAPRERCF